MYPSKKYPHYGVFVQNTENILLNNEYIVKKIVLKKIDNQKIKLLYYFGFYIKAFLFGTFGNYDYIYGHFASHVGVPLLLIKKIKKNQKIVINVHGNDIVADSQTDIKNQKISKMVITQANKVIAPSLYFKEVLQSEYNVESSKIAVYPSSGINKKIFYPLNQTIAREKIGLENQFKYIGYVGRLETAKGWDVFLNAAKKIISTFDSTIKFIIVGDGIEKEKCQELIRELSIEENVLYFSVMDQNKLNLLYNSLDVFCFPTFRKSESLGLVGLEAMACKTIVIASNNFGPTSYISDKRNGFFFESKDSNDLAKTTIEVLNLPMEAKKRIKENAYATANNFDVSSIKNILIDIFK